MIASLPPRRLGAAAAARGHRHADCPYAPDTPESVEWRLGYRQATDAITSSQRRSADVLALDRVGGVEIARHNDDEGTPELRQHAAMTTSEVREGGESRRRPRTIDLARKMKRAGFITFEREMAWRRFQKDFHIAGMDQLRASDFGRVPISGVRTRISDHVEDAKARYNDIVRTLGGEGAPAALAVIHVCGFGETINDLAAKFVFGPGHSVRPEVARGILIGAVCSLEAYYAGLKGDGD